MCQGNAAALKIYFSFFFAKDNVKNFRRFFRISFRNNNSFFFSVYNDSEPAAAVKIADFYVLFFKFFGKRSYVFIIKNADLIFAEIEFCVCVGFAAKISFRGKNIGKTDKVFVSFISSR